MKTTTKLKKNVIPAQAGIQCAKRLYNNAVDAYSVLKTKNWIPACAGMTVVRRQWLWFGALWLGGLLATVVLTLPIKLLIKAMR